MPAGLSASRPVPFPPIEPPPTGWALAAMRPLPGEDVVAVGADLDPGTLLEAYRHGLFPMGLGRHGSGPLGWWSPDPRGILLPDQLRIRSSLRKSLTRFEITIDTAFDDVVAGCADPGREARWITDAVARAYHDLHTLGWAHSVETWQGGRLVGGLYGVSIGGLFAGESMFHRVRDASKVALVGLARLLLADGDPRRLVDVQWATPHLESLGVIAVSREDYRARLAEALGAPQLDVGSATDLLRVIT